MFKQNIKFIGVHEPLWTEKEIQKLVETDCLCIEITSFTNITTWGYKTLSDNTNSISSYEVWGVIRFPRFMPVEIRFDYDDQLYPLGCWLVIKQGILPNEQYPKLLIKLSDKNRRICNSIGNALKAEIISGRKKAVISVSKHKGDGERFQEGDVYEITGLRVWESYEHKNLPTWALPTDHIMFEPLHTAISSAEEL